MRTALLFQSRNFVGREYHAQLRAHGRPPDLVVEVGEMKADSIARERERTGGRWNPPPVPHYVEPHRFVRLDDPALAELLRQEQIDVAIQAGVGILRKPLISLPRFGFLNVHPGRLPQYRGSACPEWAILEGQPVVATAHKIDGDLDTGPVIVAQRYPVQANGDYFDFRAGLYTHCAAVLIAALDIIASAEPAAWPLLAKPQAQEGARTMPQMTQDQADAARAQFPQWARRLAAEAASA